MKKIIIMIAMAASMISSVTVNAAEYMTWDGYYYSTPPVGNSAYLRGYFP